MAEHKFSPEYQDAVTRFHRNHPDAELAAHRAVLGGLPPEVAAEIVKQNAPGVAYHSQAGEIGSLPKSQHSRAVAALHAQEQGEPSSETEADNRETDATLAASASRRAAHRTGMKRGERY